jgi:hypothetical protein
MALKNKKKSKRIAPDNKTKVFRNGTKSRCWGLSGPFPHNFMLKMYKMKYLHNTGINN